MTSLEPVWTVKSILQWTQDYFKSHQLLSPRLDAELLLAFACQCSRIDLYLNYEKPLSLPEREQYRRLIKKRIQGAPVAYLLGEKDFWTLTLSVKPGVLIPRPDTETLVEKTCLAIKKWQAAHPAQECFILEVGTGTAAIPLALCSDLYQLRILSVDISEAALAVALLNVQRYQNLLAPHHNHLQLVQGNGLEMLPLTTKFDFIVSNPPYIPRRQIPQLQEEVSCYEPQQALDGGEDGLDFYRYFFEQGVKFLKSEGEMLLEIGYDQGDALQAMLPQHLKLVEIGKDLQSHPRVWHVKRAVENGLESE